MSVHAKLHRNISSHPVNGPYLANLNIRERRWDINVGVSHLSARDRVNTGTAQ